MHQLTVVVALAASLAHAQRFESAPSWQEAEAPALSRHVQLTFADDFAKAGEAYFSPDEQWIIFQAVPADEAGTARNPDYAMFVAKLERDDRDEITGIAEPIRLSEKGSANTCGWFHPTEPGVVLFGSTTTPPLSDDKAGYQREQSDYRWVFHRETEIVGGAVRAIIEDTVHEPIARAAALTRPDLDTFTPLFERDGYAAECSWSPDGRFILYTWVDPATADGDIWLYDVVSREHTPIVTEPGYDGGPFFSPDGRFITYRSDRVGNDLLQIFVAELALDPSGKPTGIEAEYQLTTGEDVNWAPYWTTDSRGLIYTSSRESHFNYELFAVPFDPESPSTRHEPVRVSHADGFDGLAVVSPSGRHLMWTAQRGADTANRGGPTSQLWIARIGSTSDLRGERGASIDPIDGPVASALSRLDADVQTFHTHLTVLASPDLGGRLPGTPGARRAADYLIRHLERFGLEPAFDGSFEQDFEMRPTIGHRGRTSRPAEGAAVEVTTVRNIGAVLPGAGALADEYLVLGAHRDHLGHGLFGSRRGRGQLHPGADDNASGTAGLLLLAEQLAKAYRDDGTDRRSIMFVFFDAEESGLNGARHFVRHPVVPLAQIELMLNFDMIGRIREGRLSLAGTPSGEGMRAWIEALAAESPLDVRLPEGLSGRSDHAPFYEQDIPVLFFTNNEVHDDYHTADDTPDKINRVAATEAVRLAERIVDRVAHDPADLVYAGTGRIERTAGSMGGVKVRFGIMPGNYNDAKPGILVQDVMSDTSAEDGGVRAGDRLMTWNGKPMTDMMAWMGYLGEHEPGDVVKVGVDRDGETVELDITLKARRQ
ncbi:MAG: M28 family peptidase [Planctomycetota bacterium]